MKSILGAGVVTYIPLIVIAVFALFVIAGLVWGIVRGLKKQTFRLAWVIVTVVILFFVTPFITRGLMNMNLSFANISIAGIKLTTISQFVADYAVTLPDFGVIIADNPEVVSTLLILAGLLLNSFVYVLMFWLAKIVLWPIWAILSAVLIKKKNAKGEKKPKHRAWGMLVGAASGIIVGATTLMPIMGVANLAVEVEKATTTIETAETPASGGIISKNGGQAVVDALNNYYNSFTAGFFKYTGIEFFNNATFNGLSTATVQNEKIVLKDEVKAVIKTVDSLQEIKKLSFKNYTKESLSKIISSARTLSNNAFNVKSLVVIGNDLLPYIINEMLTNPQFIIKLPATGNALADDIIKDSLTEVKDIKFNEVKNEFDCVLNIAELLNNQEILAPLLNNQINGAKSVLDLLNTETINNITNQVFNMKTLGTAMPVAINAGFVYMADLLSITDFEIDKGNATVEEVKSLVNAVLNIGFEAYNSLDMNSKYYVTKETLSFAGKILNAVKEYNGISEQNYNQIINGVENKVHEKLQETLNTINEKFNEVKSSVLSAIYNLSNVANFEEELTEISHVYDDALAVVDHFTNNTLNQGLPKLGKVLDGFRKTTLFGNAVNPIVSSVLKVAKTLLPAGFEDMSAILDRVAGTVQNVSSFENEFHNYTAIYDVVKAMSEEADLVNAILQPTNTLLPDFGTSLNHLKGSTLFGGEINNIVSVVLNYAKTATGTNNIIDNAFTKIEENLNTATSVNWQSEFETIKKLANISKDFTDNAEVSIESIGEQLDQIVINESALITREVVNEIIKGAIDEFAGVVTDPELEQIIAKIKTILTTNNTLSYKQELTALNSLFTEIKDIDASTLKFEEFGMLLDDYDATNGGTPSVVVSAIRTDIVTMVINKVDTTGCSTELLNIINAIKNNAANIKDYSVEFALLETFVDETTNIKNVDVNTFDFAAFGALLDSYEESALLANVRNMVVELMLNEVKDNSTDTDIKEMVDAMLAQVENITSYTTEFEKLQDFIKERNSLNNVSVDTFEFGTFGAKLDDYGTSVMLSAIRPLIVNKIVNQVQLSSTTEPDLVQAINSILNQTKATSAKCENGELTYENMFIEIGGLKQKIEDLNNVSVNKNSYDIRVFGTKLTELNNLTIVPLDASVRIHKFILTEISTQATNLLPSRYEEIAELKTNYDSFIAEITLQISQCENYLNNGTAYSANFDTDYNNVYSQIAGVMNLLP